MYAIRVGTEKFVSDLCTKKLVATLDDAFKPSNFNEAHEEMEKASKEYPECHVTLCRITYNVTPVSVIPPLRVG